MAPGCKTDYGHEEAIAVFGADPRRYQTTVKEFLPDEQGSLRAVKIVHLRPEADPKTGRTNMVEIPGTEEELPCDILLIAAGIACKVRSRALDLGLAAILFALTVRSAIRLDPYSIGYLAVAFACFAVSGLKEE